MKSLILSVAAASALAFCATAAAGPGGTTCAGAEVLSAGSTVTGDTSGAGYGNPVTSFGFTPSPGNDAIYTFTASAGMTNSETISFTSTYNAAVFLTTTCGNNTSPIKDINVNNTTGTLALVAPGNVALTAGTQYWIVVTGNPNDNTGPSGGFNFTTPTPLPVKLQKFSVK